MVWVCAITSLGQFLDWVQLPNIQQPFIFSSDQKETKDQELNLEKALLVLKEFDLDSEYGPCIGKLTVFNTVVLSIIICRGIAKTIHKMVVMKVCANLKTNLTTGRMT